MAYGNTKPLANRLFGMFANLPIGVPMSVSFKKYHLEHHRYLGVDMLDTDVPTEFEARYFNSTIRKFVWLILQPVFYAFRPIAIYNKALTDLELINVLVQLSFDMCILYFCGPKSLVYLLLGLVLGLGLHPSSGHYLSDHYVFSDTQETSSYYGPLNMVTFNVGHHVEHHDFPFIPGCNLPKVRHIAPEFYTPLKLHTSWVGMMYRFVVDPTVGLKSRVKRLRGSQHVVEYYGHYSCVATRWLETIWRQLTTPATSGSVKRD